MSSRWMAVLAACVCLTWSGRAEANLCNPEGKETARAKEEVPQMEAELFAQPVTEKNSAGSSVTQDFKGDRTYNITLLACNRKRDGLGNNIEKAIPAAHTFGGDLPVKSVKGHYRYLGLSPGLRYGYQLRREKGVWKITVPTDLVLPKSKMTDMIDIPKELAIELGLDKAGKECDPNGTKFRDGDPSKEVLSGYIQETDKGDTKKRNGARYEPACRVKRSLKGSTSWSGGTKDMTVLLKRFWQKRIKDVWNRPGFEVEPILLDLDKPSQADVNAWEKDELVWRPQLNLITYHRPTYKQWSLKFWTQIYSGVPTDVFAHEFGHQLGLDDEYNENKGPNECQSYIGETYLMCSASGFDQARLGAKGLYAWIVTRRYAAADAPQCKENSDCASGFFCAKSGLNRNVCEEKRGTCSSCSADDQCASGLECIAKPAGHCARRGALDVGDGCCANDQCKSGKCDSDNLCQCTKDGDCGKGLFCAENGLNDNVCESYRAVCSTCGSDSQCGPGATCKGTIGFQKCIVEDTLSVGARCCMDAQCKSDKCEKDECVCRKDTDCPGGKKCKTPITGQNYCE